jgi:integrase
MTTCLETVRDELELLYQPPLAAPATWKVLRQVFDELVRIDIDSPDQIRPVTVAKFMAAHPSRSCATQKKLLAGLKRICMYCCDQKYMDANPFTFRRLPDWIRRLETHDDDLTEGNERHLSLAEVTALLSCLRDEASSSWQAHRLYALAATTYYTGARAKEIQASTCTDYDLIKRLLVIRPNERRPLKTVASRRKVPLTTDATTILSEWLPRSNCRWAFPGSTRIGPWLGGIPGSKPLDLLKAAGKRAGVKDASFLALRHTHITLSVGFGVPELTTQKIAGHTRKSTTDGYRGFDMVTIRDQVDKINLGIEPPKA